MPRRQVPENAVQEIPRQLHISRSQAGDASDFIVVGIGASAGGLDACRKFLEALPADNGLAFILVQHLDPTHESMMVPLLADRTSMAVQQAVDGMRIEPNHLYVIPPGAYLSVAAGALHLSKPVARRGARMPFDFLLHSMAVDLGPRAACLVLSGTGADGSLGLMAVRGSGGLVIAQDPVEADYPGMPRNAVVTGRVDVVLPVSEIPPMLLRMAAIRDMHKSDDTPDLLPQIIELLRSGAGHDFRLYKPGTLQRRTERRMAMAAIGSSDMQRYLEMLRNDPTELARLAEDLLINVTSFFRDPQVFEVLAEKVIPDLVRGHAEDQPIRVWIAGCSTGEETYSIAMLFREAIVAANVPIKLQVFASDIDPEAIATAREGLYPETIVANISAPRLARFFSKEDHSYRISPDLRETIIFTVQDVLADPPFSRLDMISCRNLLIYLRPEAQAKVLAVFDFALQPGGILLLGTSEMVSAPDGRFDLISKEDRIYRHIGRSLTGEFGFIRAFSDSQRILTKQGSGQAPSRQAELAELCQRIVIETHAPAAVLINRKQEYLYSLGPIDRYIHVVSGHPSTDLLAMVRHGVRNKLRSAIHRAIQENAHVIVPGRQRDEKSHAAVSFNIAVQPLRHDNEDLLLVCFVENPHSGADQNRSRGVRHAPRVVELERELDATRTELQGAIHNLEISYEEQKAINDEAVSAQEEYQSTNEELLTSKEELQSLNEELTALNSQLHEALEKQRTTSNDLQNVLYSTDVATLFLDQDLNIRFFTPATTALFSVIPTDLGRPLSDLNSLTTDTHLPIDCKTVLQSLEPVEREIAVRDGSYYIRRILPYRTQGDGVEGVVITFANITDRRRASVELTEAKSHAEAANAAKSRFLAAASHDLRQPLQTLALVQGLLLKTIRGEKSRKLIGLLDETLTAMSGMLNALLDINEIETGAVRAYISDFPINEILNRLRDEFAYPAQAKGLSLRVAPCSLCVRTSPRLLEQMLRNLISNALKYTERRKVLVGCRRHQKGLRIEVWDTGIGIAADELDVIFEEYHQIGNGARERSRGLGLGLSIVRRLGELLDHSVHVRSWLGKGSVFSVDVPVVASTTLDSLARHGEAPEVPHRAVTIVVIEDDPDVRELLEAVLRDDGHQVITARDGIVALEQVRRGGLKPDLILADYNLPLGMDGVRATILLREAVQRSVPAIILTGDISTTTSGRIAVEDCVCLAKPIKPEELTQAIQHLLQSCVSTRIDRPHPIDEQGASATPVIFVVDDDNVVRSTIRGVLEEDGRVVEDFPTCEAFLEAFRPGRRGCLVVDAYLPGMSGLDLLRLFHERSYDLPAIMITGHSDVRMAVQAMKAGALDFIEKPVGHRELLACVDRALGQSSDSSKLSAWREHAASRVSGLTERQRQVLELVLAGHPSKNIAVELGVSQRTVDNHRAAIMRKMGTRSLPALARLALAAEFAPKAVVVC